MDRETIYQLGLSSGCINPDLSGPDNWVTDYGGCEGCLTKFAQLVAAHEREACATEADKLASLLGEHNHLSHQGVAMAIAAKIRMRT